MYIAVFILFFLFVLIENFNIVPLEKRNFLFFLIGSLLVLHDGLRWDMATDFSTYLDHFNYINTNTNTYESFEILYEYLVKFSKFLVDSYTFFLLLHAVILYSLYIVAIKKYTDYGLSALAYLYVSMIGFLGSNRQLISLAICFFSLRFIVEKKRWFFFGLILVAYGFHQTAIIFGLFYFLDKKINFIFLIGALVVAAVLSKINVVIDFFDFFTLKLFPQMFEDKAEAYLLSNDSFGNEFIATIFGIIRKVVPIVVLLYIKKEGFRSKYYNIILNGSFLSLTSYILFNNNLQFLVGRLTIYLSIFECVIYSWLLIILYKSKSKFISILFFAVLCIIIFFRSIALYPQIFIPYKSILI